MRHEPITIGSRYGSLVVTDAAPAAERSDGHRRSRWRVRCDCGVEIDVLGASLKSGNTTSCGCRHRKFAPIADGQRYGRWLILRADAASKGSWLARCDCGTERAVCGSTLKNGTSQSCGCAGDAAFTRRITTHGASHTPEYKAWEHMKHRCYVPKNPRFPHYGGRGIVVCDRWRESFAAFLADMGPRPSSEHSIDREDNNGNYEPGNCRWATETEQRRNRRNNHMITAFGETLCLTDWSARFGVSDSGIQKRLDLGWSPERAVSEPSVPQRRLSRRSCE